MHSIFWALLVLALVATLLRMDWVYYLVYVVGGIWVVSHWWVRRCFQLVDIERDIALHAFPGETILGRIKMRNRSWFPMPWVHVQESVPFELQEQNSYRTVLTVGGRANNEYPYRLRCNKRGYFPVGPLRLQTGDLFGFVSSAWQEGSQPYVTVYPRVIALEKLGLPSRSPFGTLSSRRQIFEDPARVAGVRDYESGDSLRSIHWKATAREDSLQVKKLQPAIALDVTIILDLNRKAYPILGAIGYSEWAITAAASVASHMIIQQRQQVGLLTNGKDSISEELPPAIPSRAGRGHLMSILSQLARIQLHELDTTLSEWIPGQLTNLEWGTTLVVVAPTLDEQALWALHNAYRRGSNVVALLCAPENELDLIQAQGKQLGILVHKTVWEQDLHTV
ncbi:DUF58 domain-containing protein [Chloroflexi bacterium TSY]|nr:DUF58 domain-containing protein [Chloroflexi bacterium TSY]